MNCPLSDERVVRALASHVAQRIIHKVIRKLQRLKDTLAGVDTGLTTVWEEICAQAQTEQSYHWDSYDDTVRAVIGSCLGDLLPHERQAIWLQTAAGEDWYYEADERREPSPVCCDDDIVDYLVADYIYEAAGQWSNARIRAFIERSDYRD